MKITSEILKLIGACEHGITWLQKNGLEGFPLNRINEIQGDHEKFVAWIKDNYPSFISRIKDGVITLKSEGLIEYSWEKHLM